MEGSETETFGDGKFCFICEKNIKLKNGTFPWERKFLLEKLLKLPLNLFKSLEKNAWLCNLCLKDVRLGVKIVEDIDKLQERLSELQKIILGKVKGVKNTALRGMGVGVKKYGKKTTPSSNKPPVSKKNDGVVVVKVEEFTVIDMDEEEDVQKGSFSRAATPPMINLEEIPIEQNEECVIVCEGDEEFEDPLALSPEPVEEEMEVVDDPTPRVASTAPAGPAAWIEYLCGHCSGNKTFKTEKELEEHTKTVHKPRAASNKRFASVCYPSAKKKTGDNPPTSISKPPPRKIEASAAIPSSPPKKKAKVDDNKKPEPLIEKTSKTPQPKKGTSDFSLEDCIFRYDCPNCPDIVNYGINAYAQHLSIHMRRPYKCTFCLELLPEDESTWEEHWKANHSGTKHDSVRFLKVELDPGLIFKCDGCKIGYKSQKERNRHEEKCPRMEAKAHLLKASGISPDASKKTCATCQKILRNRDEWRLHRLLLHPEIDRLSCYSCDETFEQKRVDCGAEVVIERNDEKLEEHLYSKHRTHLFQECEPCGAVFFFCKGSNWEALKHAKDKHGVGNGKVFKCRMCPSRFQRLAEVFIHAKISHFGTAVIAKKRKKQKRRVMTFGKYRYNCPTCPEVKDYSLTAYVKHLEIHRRRPYKCGECSAFLPDDKDAMNTHWDKHPDVKQDLNSFQRVELDPGPIWKCFGCSQGYRSEFQRRKHEKTCGKFSKSDPTKEKPFTCATCKSSFRTGDEWRLHRFLQHAEVDRLSCLYCDKSFGELPKSGEKQERHDEKLFEHVRDVHPVQFRSDFSRKLYEFCEECGLVFQKQQETKKHFKDKHGVAESGKIYQCRLCPAKKLTPTNLRRHISSAHFEQFEDKYDCPECPQIKKYSLYAYAQHLAIHQRRPCRCSVCKEFLPDTESAWEEHWKENHADLLDSTPLNERILKKKLNPGLIYKCGGCFAGYLTEKDRDSHEKSCFKMKKLGLSDEKMTCVICKKVLRNFNEWRLHRLLEHAEVDRTSCPYCDESFLEKTIAGGVDRNDFKLHKHIIQTHNMQGSRLYDECDRCGIVFDKIRETVAHMKDKHGLNAKETYECRICNKKQERPDRMRAHMYVFHFREESSMCDLCGKEFNLKIKLFEHKFKEHQENEGNLPVRKCKKEGCDFVCLFAKTINTHTYTHRDKICEICGRGFQYNVELQRHVAQCSKSEADLSIQQSRMRAPKADMDKQLNRFGRYDCPSPMCPEVQAYSLIAYLQHLDIHRRLPYRCKNCCEFLPNDRTAWDEHWQKEHFRSIYSLGSESEAVTFTKLDTGPIWKCKGCPERFPTEVERTSHERQCGGPSTESTETYQCKGCPRKFRNMHEWRFHRFLEHPHLDQMSCPYCDEYFGQNRIDVEGEEARNDAKLHHHIVETHLKYIYGSRLFEECLRCGLVFIKKRDMENHFKDKHGLSTEDLIYTCRICGKKRTNGYGVRYHQEGEHFTGKPRQCDQCGVKFQREDTVLEHKLQVHGNNEKGLPLMNCEEEGCAFTCLFKKTMISHRINHGEYDKTCSFCGRAFVRAADLRKHEDIHKTKGFVKSRPSIRRYNDGRRVFVKRRNIKN